MGDRKFVQKDKNNDQKCLFQCIKIYQVPRKLFELEADPYIKSWKKLYKIRLQRDFFETCNKWVKW